ncbi:DUF1538 domain-containing protein [Treponema phagedenis]|uniref:DUF1538 domain-containing protein n=2 Tax=Treponema phagedenis TaxID=162 RepID=UPI00165671EB|nr:DUF1538 domain-containing protein [Treponema phagedenis]
MNVRESIKSTAISVLPICVIVLLLHVTVTPLPASEAIAFTVGSALVILGLGLFLLGMNLAIMPVGSFLGAALTRTRKIFFILGAGAVVGFIITVAEPNLLILARQAESVTGAITTPVMILVVAIGVALSVVIGLARSIFQISYRLIMLIMYGLAFLLAIKVHPTFVAMAFDSGGATTGPLTVPFIIALGIGAASVRGDKEAHDDSFGYTGLTVAGPVLVVIAYAFILALQGRGGLPEQLPETIIPPEMNLSIMGTYVPVLLQSFKNVAFSVSPFVLILLFFNVTLLKLPPKQMRRIIIGIVYSYFGLVIFFTGTDTGFIPAAFRLGTLLGQLSYHWILVPIGCVAGAVVVCAEPSTWALVEQVEDLSGGNIRKSVMLVSLAIGVSLFIGLAMLRIILGFSVWVFLIPSFIITFILTLFAPPLFIAIAFDSGSVASGPMSSTFVLSLALGASTGLQGNPAIDAFGLIAMTSLSPLISIQILGILFKKKQEKLEKKGEK